MQDAHSPSLRRVLGARRRVSVTGVYDDQKTTAVSREPERDHAMMVVKPPERRGTIPRRYCLIFRRLPRASSRAVVQPPATEDKCSGAIMRHLHIKVAQRRAYGIRVNATVWGSVLHLAADQSKNSRTRFENAMTAEQG